MKNWLTSFFLLFALVSGVFAGMPFHAEKTGMMKCCDKAKSKEQSPAVTAAQLCCALNCTDSTPTSSGLSFNFSQSLAIEDSIAAQIIDLFKIKRIKPSIPHSYDLPLVSRSFPPKYIQHHSFLI